MCNPVCVMCACVYCSCVSSCYYCCCWRSEHSGATRRHNKTTNIISIFFVSPTASFSERRKVWKWFCAFGHVLNCADAPPDISSVPFVVGATILDRCGVSRAHSVDRTRQCVSSTQRRQSARTVDCGHLRACVSMCDLL